MSLNFTGRKSELDDIENLVKEKQGAVFAVSGNAGIGKSNHFVTLENSAIWR